MKANDNVQTFSFMGGNVPYLKPSSSAARNIPTSRVRHMSISCRTVSTYRRISTSCPRTTNSVFMFMRA